MCSPKHNGDVLLPTALRTRWQPMRGGLLNIYRYDYQEFRYEDGRLLLRGNNGTGKSRVLALQLPFLLDGKSSRNASSRIKTLPKGWSGISFSAGSTSTVSAIRGSKLA